MMNPIGSWLGFLGLGAVLCVSGCGTGSAGDEHSRELAQSRGALASTLPPISVECDTASCCPASFSPIVLTNASDIHQNFHANRCIVARGGLDQVQSHPSSGATAISGGDGNDILQAFPAAGPAYVRGGQGDDQINAGGTVGGTNLILGNDGADQISGGNGPDWIVGGPGRDQVQANGAADTVAIYDLCEAPSGEVLNGGPGQDILITPVPITALAARGVSVTGFETVVVTQNSCKSDCVTRPVCPPNATCAEGSTPGDVFCKCLDNWSGPDCSIPVAPVTGQVLLNGAPVAGAIVSLAGFETTTDAQGHFSFEKIPLGEHEIGTRLDANGEVFIDRTNVDVVAGSTAVVSLALKVAGEVTVDGSVMVFPAGGAGPEAVFPAPLVCQVTEEDPVQEFVVELCMGTSNNYWSDVVVTCTRQADETVRVEGRFQVREGAFCGDTTGPAFTGFCHNFGDLETGEARTLFCSPNQPRSGLAVLRLDAHRSCGAQADACDIGADCCGTMVCKAGACSVCSQPGQACLTTAECCDRLTCKSGLCDTCSAKQEACAVDEDCCSGLSCEAGVCAPPCRDGASCSTGKRGECRAGALNCADPFNPLCEQLTLEVPETCNGNDDDCDGSTDEEFPEQNVACVPSFTGCQAGFAVPGENVCLLGQLECQEVRCDTNDADATNCFCDSSGAAVGGHGLPCGESAATPCAPNVTKCSPNAACTSPPSDPLNPVCQQDNTCTLNPPDCWTPEDLKFVYCP